jgi:hypothetical protein
MLQSIPTFQPVTKTTTDSAHTMSRSYATPSDYYDPSADEDDDDFFSDSLGDIDFNQLAVEDDKEFTYDNDTEEDIEDDEED